MLAQLALAAALIVAATHLVPEPTGSPLPRDGSRTGTVILTAPDPDANVGEPGRCPQANAQPAYRDLSGMALILPASPVAPEAPGPRP
ncbi:MAG: hypothetical protein F4Y53_00285 [Proteobacteria bacterium]|nr:hypothetical protein [Pseudomonadota bacterium]